MEARVLLVEDEPELLEFVRIILEREHYEVVAATDGVMALEMARTAHPDIILLDVLLPKMHGYEVCDRLRQDPVTCLIPVIMVTSLTTLKDRVTGIKLGADEFVSKPFEPLELLARVERLIQRSRQNMAGNPLTGLAGVGALDQEVKRRLSARENFSLGVCDVNGLGKYNELFGFDKGDGVLRLVATILRSAVAELGNPDDLVVHLGGDDFAFISTPARSSVVSARILENVESLIPMQYDDESREKGKAVVKSPGGETIEHPFLSLSIGLVDITAGLYQHQAQVFDRAKNALSQSKLQGPNHFFKLT